MDKYALSMSTEEKKYLVLCVFTTCVCLLLFTAFAIQRTAPSSAASSSSAPAAAKAETAAKVVAPTPPNVATLTMYDSTEHKTDPAYLGREYAEKGDLELALDYLTVRDKDILCCLLLTDSSSYFTHTCVVHHVRYINLLGSNSIEQQRL
jgi:hypothetical protein